MKYRYEITLAILLAVIFIFIYELANGLELPIYGFIGVLGYLCAFWIYMHVLCWLLDKITEGDNHG